MEKPQAVRSFPKTSPLKAPSSKGLVLARITITHPERVISETGQVTKGELAEYHAAVALYMLPRLLHHPLSLLRCPSGIGNQCFYQRNPDKGLGADVRPFKFRHKGKNYEYLYIEDVKGLLEIIQMGSIRNPSLGRQRRRYRPSGPDDTRSRPRARRSLRGRQAGRAGFKKKAQAQRPGVHAQNAPAGRDCMSPFRLRKRMTGRA
jgi:hypothetical protein